MEVRGIMLRGIHDYASQKHKEKYNEWLSKLPQQSSALLENLSNTAWYNIEDALLKPLEVLCGLIYSDPLRGSWEIGRYSAETGLTGIYKVFVMVSTPTFILKRAPRILTTFYNPSELKIEESSSKGILVRCTKLPVNSELIEHRIAGWIEKAGEICGCVNMKVEIVSSMAKGDQVFDLKASWD
ncbi:hypothetical protein N6H18_17695 [Reichenbachiella agarivorans]|uniref:Uncharacterized protein n=1 Tax=Reichenbachiella agarivorans TaxID=2979464 RepID=A0ABY6CNT4_9BACT|nr:hypothetical protein [Reichenbachiella agarivorans]UXP32176.1 hypothetical protein N6H18_17695 [Reichenbachiella agarivorans]